ncbi:MAG: beta-1,6-N-acetylglucosaminyltransferase [Aggregatilineales bacterium]
MTHRRIAYTIIGHQDPAHIIRLVRRLHTPQNTFIIHYDKKSDDAGFQQLQHALTPSGGVHFIARHPVYWGNYSLADTIFRAVACLLTQQIQFDHVAILSGQDYPLKSNDIIQQTLSQYHDRQLFHYFPLPYTDWQPDNGMMRFQKYHFYLSGHRFEYPPFNLRRKTLAKLIGWKNRQIPLGYKPYGGSGWFILNREGAQYLHDFAQSSDGKQVLKFFQHTIIPDEMLFHTIFMNSPLRDSVHNDNYWLIDWSRRDKHPETLRMSHLAALTAGDRLFARKFDAQIDGDILDALDAHMMRQSEPVRNELISIHG